MPSSTISNGGSSSTTVVELAPVYFQNGPHIKRFPAPLDRRLGSFERGCSSDEEDRNESLPSPSIASKVALVKWNSSRRTIARLLSAFFAMGVMGMNDATYGAIIPYLETYYGLSYTIVSLVFLSPLVGYNAAALLNNTIHLRFGQRGVACIGPLCHLVAYIVIAAHPPYPILVFVFTLAGFGNGLQDAAWNAWIGNMANANELLGFLHGFYGAGATIAPLIATAMITQAKLEWFCWYYVMIAAAAIEAIMLSWSFWNETAMQFREDNPRMSDETGNRMMEALFTKPNARVTWLCAVFFLGYVGIEVALGGWIVTFMIRVRHGGNFASGMTATGFWLGITMGRLILGFVTPRIGEKLSIAIYLPIAAGLELLFWLVPQFYVSAIAVSFQGFFLGPMFPAGIVMCTKLLPRHLHVSAIGFAAAFGGSGGAIFPFVTGVIAQARGVKVLQPIILSLLVAIWACWMALPKLGRKRV